MKYDITSKLVEALLSSSVIAILMQLTSVGVLTLKGLIKMLASEQVKALCDLCDLCEMAREGEIKQ